MTARMQPSQGGDTRAIEAWLRTRRAEEALRRTMVSRSGCLDTGVALPVMGVIPLLKTWSDFHSSGLPS